MYGSCGASEHWWEWFIWRWNDLGAGLNCDWWTVMARLFSFVRAKRAGWYWNIDRETQGNHYDVFYGYFLAVLCVVVTCYVKPRPAGLVRARRRAAAINPDPGRRLFEFFFYLSAYFFLIFRDGVFDLWVVSVTRFWVQRNLGSLNSVLSLCFLTYVWPVDVLYSRVHSVWLYRKSFMYDIFCLIVHF